MGNACCDNSVAPPDLRSIEKKPIAKKKGEVDNIMSIEGVMDGDDAEKIGEVEDLDLDNEAHNSDNDLEENKINLEAITEEETQMTSREATAADQEEEQPVQED